ncbi:hypothetical protein RFI_10028 [Reticulomyxa filosa]|uniref:Dilute domain-containing protein n=1 Tax=Reticulomyxa filosa TaxID=46433 RepID=X6NLD6_RETFI|nr:hypothetical protein RFI_10028 [Reticulomyxa filosa]|eukprot:ETO27105.1 hypothetical protein RFI_10028 [Reticulomyxa filosa]
MPLLKHSKKKKKTKFHEALCFGGRTEFYVLSPCIFCESKEKLFNLDLTRIQTIAISKKKVSFPKDGGHVEVFDTIKLTSTICQSVPNTENSPEIANVPGALGLVSKPKEFVLSVVTVHDERVFWQTTIDLSNKLILPKKKKKSTKKKGKKQSKLKRQLKSFTLKSKHGSGQEKSIPLQISVRVSIQCTSCLKTNVPGTVDIPMLPSKTQPLSTLPHHWDEHYLMQRPQTQPDFASSLHTANKSDPLHHFFHSVVPSPQLLCTQPEHQYANENTPPPKHLETLLRINNNQLQPPSTQDLNETSCLCNGPIQNDTHSGNYSDDQTIQDQEREEEQGESQVTLNENNATSSPPEVPVSLNEDKDKNMAHPLTTLSIELDTTSTTVAVVEDRWPSAVDMDKLNFGLIHNCASVNTQQRFWEGIPKNAVILLHCLIHWKMFQEEDTKEEKEQKNNTNDDDDLKAKHFDLLTQINNSIQLEVNQSRFDNREQAFWLIVCTSLRQWLQTIFQAPLSSFLSTQPSVNEETAKCSESNTSKSKELLKWFLKQLKALADQCYHNIMQPIIKQMEQLPLEDIFEKEHGETGSPTIDLVFSSFDPVINLLADVKIFDGFRSQMASHLIDLLVVRIGNLLLLNAQFCTLASGFRLKIVISMFNTWHFTHFARGDSATLPHSLAALTDISTLLLTCATMSNCNQVLAMCQRLNVVQIYHLLQNYNSLVTKDLKVDKDHVLRVNFFFFLIRAPLWNTGTSKLKNTVPISVKALRRPSQQKKGHNLLLELSVEGIDWKNEIAEPLLPKVAISNIDVPLDILNQAAFAFLRTPDGSTLQ